MSDQHVLDMAFIIGKDHHIKGISPFPVYEGFRRRINGGGMEDVDMGPIQETHALKNSIFFFNSCRNDLVLFRSRQFNVLKRNGIKC